MQCAMDTLLQPFFNKMSGYSKKATFTIAQLGDVKDKPELKEFEAQVKEILKASYNKGTAEFKAAAEKYVPAWEKAAAYAGEGDVNEVKRAAYQNLATYYLFTGDPQKAKEYIELYKPIDKVQSMMMGMVKYKESENLEKTLAELYPVNDAKPFDTGGALVSLDDLVDTEKFISIDGTIALKGKKDAGSYTGKIKISKLPQEASGNIIDLDGNSGELPPGRLMAICAIVLAAGEGRRLRPLTTVRPKALCPVGNVALLDRALARVAGLGLTGRTPWR